MEGIGWDGIGWDGMEGRYLRGSRSCADPPAAERGPGGGPTPEGRSAVRAWRGVAAHKGSILRHGKGTCPKNWTLFVCHPTGVFHSSKASSERRVQRSTPSRAVPPTSSCTSDVLFAMNTFSMAIVGTCNEAVEGRWRERGVRRYDARKVEHSALMVGRTTGQK